MALHEVGVLAKWDGPPEEASRPFDRLRSGLVIAEGAAMVIVEDEENALARGARIYARILGVGESNEGAHLRKVDQTGTAGARAMTLAIQEAGLMPRDIDHVAAHGNSMPDYDAAVAEIRAAPPLPAVPAVVVTADEPWNLPVGEAGPTWPAWTAAQDRLAELLHATHVTDTDSGHAINVEQPGVVVGAVREVVDAVRGGTG